MKSKSFIVAFALALLMLTPAAWAQNTQKTSNLNLTDSVIHLNQLVITSLRVDRKLMQTPASVVVAPVISFQKNAALTVANVLATEPGVAFGGDGIWSTNTTIRGFGENRLITLIDGNRVETATDLTASMSMLDVNDVERVEVIKGAQSSLYGTGAMGGFINIITKQGRFSDKPYFDGEWNSGFSSVNRYFSNNLSLSTGARKWYLRLSGTVGDAQDVRTPLGIMENSQFTTTNWTAKLGFKPAQNHLFKVQYQDNASFNVGIPGGASFPGPAEAKYKRIGRRLLDASYEIKNISPAFTSLKASYFYQDNDRDVQVKPNTVTTTRLANGNTQLTTPSLLAPKSNHRTHGAQLQAIFDFSDNNTFIAGADFFTRSLNTSRVKLITVNVLNPKGDTLKTNQLERGETPIPTSTSTTTGLYFQDEARFLDNRLTATVGARLDGIWMKNQAGYDVDYIVTNGNRSEPPASQKRTFAPGQTFNTSWSANLGLLYKVTRNTDLVFNASRSYRAPSLEERFKYIDLGNYVRLGKADLKPEDGMSADLGIRYWGDHFVLQASFFANKIGNMIVETPGEFIYQLTATSGQDTLAALVNANVSKALLYGMDFKAEYNVVPNLVLSLSGSYVRGRDVAQDTNLPLMPPLSGRLGARYSFASLATLELNLTGVARQDKIAEGESVTDGYMRLDLSLYTRNFALGNFGHLRLFAGVDNLTNTTYTNHLATNRGSISVEPGRNFFLRLCLAF